MASASSTSAVVALMDHKRAETTWVCRAILDGDKPKIERIARIVCVYPTDGAGRLRVAVTDWGKLGADHTPAHYTGQAGGYGYDKMSAALDGATIGGFTIGDHCDRDGNPTLRDLCQREGWEIIGSL